MALRCSVLGHAWGESEVEREHEARGSEAVVTVREFRTCKRCGDRDVLGEVTEVKPADEVPPEGSPAPDEVEGIRDDSPPESVDASAESDDGEPVTDDAEIIDADGSTEHADGQAADRTAPGRASADRPETGRPDAPDRAADEVPDEGAEIIDADEEPDRDPAEWPDPGLPDDDDVEYERKPWPNADPPDPEPRERREPDPYEAVEPTADRPEGGDPVDPAEVLSEAASEQDGASDDDGEDPDPAEVQKDLPLEEVEVFCPNCDFVDESPTPSLRGGDSCPTCRTSYLEEREGQE